MAMFVAGLRSTQTRKVGLVAGAAVALAFSTSSALAQCVQTNNTGPLGVNNIPLLASPVGAASASIAGVIGSVNSVFLTQQGSAFVSAPANPQPNQPGGGVWARGVGGEVDVKSTSVSTGVATAAAGQNNTGVTCANQQHENFAGVQVGADIARLNWNGWNVHLGTTAGYLSSKSNDGFAFSNRVEVPFFGTYVVATHGRFFADLMVREDFYNISLNN